MFKIRKTKIIATIGPSCGNVEILMKMLEAGLNVARLNFSHGTREGHLKYIKALKEASSKTKKPLAIMLDTKGPEIRLGYLENNLVGLEEGQEVILTTKEILGNKEILPVIYKGLPQNVQKGDKILISDGLISLEVLGTSQDEVKCLVENEGEISSQKGVNLPGIAVNLPAITEKDKEDIAFGVEQEVDFIAASFVRKAGDILEIKELVAKLGGEIDIIAKIENREALNNLDEIIQVSDGVMVARGDLGVEIPVEEIPLAQKIIIDKCNVMGKPVIIATQMLESMISNPRPTRAEASDVANAVFDRTDAIMLSAETAAGEYPLDALKTMSRIAKKAESVWGEETWFGKTFNPKSQAITDAISHATCTIAHDLGAKFILTFTETGHTARMVSKYRPLAPITAISPNPRVIRKMALVWGVYPLLVERAKNTDAMIDLAISASLRENLIFPGDLVVITAGVPVGINGTTNLIKVHLVGDLLAKGSGIVPKSVSGKIKICTSPKEALAKIKKGDILVVQNIYKEYIQILEKAGGLITQASGLTSEGAIIGLQLGIPTVVGVDLSLFQEGETVTIDGQRGLIYRGKAKIL